MDGTRGCYAKGNKSVRERQYNMISLMWNLRKQMNMEEGKEK